MTDFKKRYYKVLTIGGSDSGGGAGIQADLKTFSALGCYGMSVLTALTAQNTKQVTSIFDVSPEFVSAQLDAVLSDIGADAVKIGMIHRPEIIRAIADGLRRYDTGPIVLDPVMVAKSGDQLLRRDAVEALKQELVPLASVLTPNLPEASVLLGRVVERIEDMERAAYDLLGLGPKVVLLKGGHAGGASSNDFAHSVASREWFETNRTETSNTHGTGCTYSSAIAAFLAKGEDPFAAIGKAKAYLSGAIEAGAAFGIGSGHGPVHHFHQLWPLIDTTRNK